MSEQKPSVGRRYRKKPVEVEAILARDAIRYAGQAWDQLPEWLSETYEHDIVVFGPTEVFIKTLEGTMRAGKDDWIIRGVQGELYPCKPDIFEATYEAVS
jgi:hypothetical protein